MSQEYAKQIQRFFSSKSNGGKLVHSSATNKLHRHRQILLATNIVLLLLGVEAAREKPPKSIADGGDPMGGIKPAPASRISDQLRPDVGSQFTSGEPNHELVDHFFTQSLWAPLILVLVCSYIATKQWANKRSSAATPMGASGKLSPMPSPPPMPIIGHIHLLRHYQHNPWEGFNAIREQYGDVVALKMGIHPMVLVSSREAIQEILLKKSAIFADRPTFPRHHIIFGGDKENSLALCNWSSTHRDRRKLCKRGIVPNRFSSRNELLESIVCRRSAKFVQDLSHKFSNQSSNSVRQQIGLPNADHSILTKADILLLTSDVFMDFLCGEEYSHSNKLYRQFAKGCDFVFWDINQSYLIDFLPILTSLGLGYFYLKRLKDETDFLRNFIDDEIFDPRLIGHKKEAANEKSYLDESSSINLLNMDEETNNSEETTNNNHLHNPDYLDSLILEYLSKSTSMSLADYKVGFADLLAGHAAVANILIRVLGHLALDEKIQDLIRAEADETDLFNLDHKPSLPITEAALLEALRLASSPIVPHVARENTSVGQFYVPAGSMVLFNIYHHNLSESIWKNPYNFDPMRFIDFRKDELGKSVPKLNVPKHFMPFSVGMRQCLGQKMVESTSIVTIANLCRKFIIRPNKEQLVRELLAPKGCVALNPDVECFELKLFARCN